MQQKELVPVEDDGQEFPCNSWGEAMARTLWVVGHATLMALDTYESPARACARSAQSDNLQGIDEATMQFIVKDPQCTVQTFFTPRPQFFSGLRLQDRVCPGLSLGTHGGRKVHRTACAEPLSLIAWDKPTSKAVAPSVCLRNKRCSKRRCSDLSSQGQFLGLELATSNRAIVLRSSSLCKFFFYSSNVTKIVFLAINAPPPEYIPTNAFFPRKLESIKINEEINTIASPLTSTILPLPANFFE